MSSYGLYRRDYPEEYAELRKFYKRIHTCDCGSIIKVGSLNKHLGSNKHQNYLEENNISNATDIENNKKYLYPPRN